jgi:hypothetical protein
MPAPSVVVLLAVTVLVTVATALGCEVLVLRRRRDVDQYLQWLMESAVGPLTLSPPPRWF